MQDRQLKKRNRAILVPTSALFVLTVMSACSGSAKAPAPAPAPAPSSLVQKQTVTSGPTKTTENQQIVAVYTYNPAGRRDPFAPIIQHENKKTKSGDRPPLERYNLTEFKLSGIIWGGFGYNAMVEGPDGKGYFIRVGTALGPNRGIVKKITQNTVIVEEKYKNYAGETESKETVIELRKKQEAMP